MKVVHLYPELHETDHLLSSMDLLDTQEWFEPDLEDFESYLPHEREAA